MSLFLSIDVTVVMMLLLLLTQSIVVAAAAFPLFASSSRSRSSIRRQKATTVTRPSYYPSGDDDVCSSRTTASVRGRLWGEVARRSPRSSLLYANRYSSTYDDDDYDYGDYNEAGRGPTRKGKQKKKGNRRSSKKWDNNNEYGYDVTIHEEDEEEVEDNAIGDNDKDDDINDLIRAIQTAANQTIQENRWDASVELDKEKNSENACWEYRDEIHAAINRVNEGLVERDEESRLVVLAMLAKEHVLLVGVPGTGKSVLGRRLSRLCRGQFFQRLLTRFTTPEEIFGPLSLKALERDEYRRCTAGFLPTASVAFLDEIFKANSAILNTLLTILNERKFENGNSQQQDTSSLCPIKCVVGASNELPESEELDALYDRFLIRKEVSPVSPDGVMTLLTMSNPGYSPCDDDDNDSSIDEGSSSSTEGTPVEGKCDVVFVQHDLDEVIHALHVAATSSVTIGDDVCILIRDLRDYLSNEDSMQDTQSVCDVSDRRLVKSAQLLKLSAASHGRDRVDMIDCLLLQHTFWNVPEQRDTIKDWLYDHLTPTSGGGGAESGTTTNTIRLLLNGLRRESITIVRKTSGDVSGSGGARDDELAVIESIRIEVQRLSQVLKQKQTELIRHIELLNRSSDHLWLHPDEAISARQILLPKAIRCLIEVDQNLLDARALEMTLLSDDNKDVVPNELRLSVIEQLWDDDDYSSALTEFTDDELSIGMKEAKAKYDLETFRKWKRARKRAQ